MGKYLEELKIIQKEYFNLISSFGLSDSEDTFYSSAVNLIEKCEHFWTSKVPQIDIILADLTQTEHCFILEGAVYLDTKNNGHYKYVTLGDYHFLNDPFVKMRNLFAFGKGSVTKKCKEYFINAYNDTLSILKDYPNTFYFISLEVLCAKEFDENIDIGEKVYWDIISDALGNNYRSITDLENNFDSIDELECVIRPELNKHFIFSSKEDVELPLKTRIDDYCKYNQEMARVKYKTEMQKFYCSTISYIQQAVCITLKCLQYRLHPFIRFDITFHYLFLLFNCFQKDENVDILQRDLIISFIMATRILGNEIKDIPFDVFASICKKGKLYEQICENSFPNDQNIAALHLKDVVKCIEERYHALFGIRS